MKAPNIETTALLYQLAAHTPRVLVALAALVGATSCVSAKRYEDAQTAAWTHAEARQVEQDRRRAAEQLGVSYKTLLNKIKECGISRQ